MLLSFFKDMYISKKYPHVSSFELKSNSVDFCLIEKGTAVKRSMFVFNKKLFGLPSHMELAINKKFYWHINGKEMIVSYIHENPSRTGSFASVRCNFKTEEKMNEIKSLINKG